MKRLFLVLASILVFALGSYAVPETSPTSGAASASGFQGVRLVQAAHRRHAHRAGHHKRRRARAHHKRA